MSTMQSKGRRQSGAEQSSEQPPQEVVDRLAELLPQDALEDALKGLEGQDITGAGGLLAQLAGRVIHTALGAELTEHLGHPPRGRRCVGQRPQRGREREDAGDRSRPGAGPHAA